MHLNYQQIMPKGLSMHLHDTLHNTECQHFRSCASIEACEGLHVHVRNVSRHLIHNTHIECDDQNDSLLLKSRLLCPVACITVAIGCIQQLMYHTI